MRKIVSFVLLVVFVPSLPSAPVPKPRKESCPLVGSWVYCWGGARGAAEFHRDGSYKCTFGSNVWEGSYGYSGGLLHIFEREASHGYSFGEWGLTVIHLDKKLKGRATSDVGRAILGDGISVEFMKK